MVKIDKKFVLADVQFSLATYSFKVGQTHNTRIATIAFKKNHLLNNVLNLCQLKFFSENKEMLNTEEVDWGGLSCW